MNSTSSVRTSVIIPEYQELTRHGSDFSSNLDYFAKFSDKFDDKVKLVLVDDASRDGSKEFLEDYLLKNNPKFNVMFMESNGKKIGAIKKAVIEQDASVESILLTDFDSRIPYNSMNNFDAMIGRLYDSKAFSSQIGGLALRVVGERNNFLQKIQDVEYAIGRGFHRILGENRVFKNHTGMNRCVAGAGGLWDRSVLEEIFPEHSGRHNGDDYELTALAMKHGYAIDYFSDFVIETSTPLRVKDLYKQRVRWELGALETIVKEKDFFKDVVTLKKSKRFGFFTGWQIATYAMLPLTVGVAGYQALKGNLDYFLLYYASDLIATSIPAALNRDEIDFNKKTLMLWPLWPFYNVLTQYPTRLAAQVKLVKNELLKIRKK